MDRTDEPYIRPEEALFAGLFIMILALHIVLQEPYAPLVWAMQMISDYPPTRNLILGLGIGCGFVGGAVLLSQRIASVASRAFGLVRDFLPFCFMVIVYESAHSLGPRIHNGTFDTFLMQADYQAFRSVVFWDVPLWIIASPHVRPCMFYFAFCYGAIFVVYWGFAIYLRGCRDRRIFRKYVLSIALTSCLGYLGYLAVPALGPYEGIIRRGAAPFNTSISFGEFDTISIFADQIRQLHFDKLPASDAFPSLHTAWAIVVLGFAFQHERRLAWAIAPWAVGTIFGALFFQQHYLIDVVCALPTAIIGTLGACWLVDQRLPFWSTEVACPRRAVC